MPSVKIRIERGTETAGDGNQGQQSDKQRSNVAVESIFAHQMIGLGKQIVSYSASNIGNFTGNYIEQDRVNSILDVLGDTTTVTLGFVSGGWVGGAVAVVGIATKKVFQTITDVRQSILSERDRNYLVARSGNSTTNGSRGTEG